MSSVNVVPDSSFYICFLDDINAPHYLLQLLNARIFKFILGKIIKTEIEKSPNYKSIEKTIDSRVEIFEYYNYGEILRPFFSLEEIKKGDNEVIVISYVLYFLNLTFITILDDTKPRKFLERNFPELYTRVVGTVGFIEKCSCQYNIFSKEKGITILNLIKKSKFRIKNEIVNKTIERIGKC
ncbi:MAG: hypothetical protein Q6352_011905 [Candidatus Freyrarchaeum guaymaensis]